MRDRLPFGAVVGVAVLAALIDFTSRVLSVVADGALMLALVGAVLVLRRGYRAEVAALRSECARLRVTGGMDDVRGEKQHVR